MFTFIDWFQSLHRLSVVEHLLSSRSLCDSRLQLSRTYCCSSNCSSQVFKQSSRKLTTMSLPRSSSLRPSPSALNSFTLIRVSCRSSILCWVLKLFPPISFSPSNSPPPSSALIHLVKCFLIVHPSSLSSDAPRAGMSWDWLTLSRCSSACESVCRRLAQ